MQILRGRKALVTGAASGTGRAMALALAREGADLFLVDRDAPRLYAAARETQLLGVRVLTYVCDLIEAFATGTPGQKRHIVPAWLSTSPEHVAAVAIKAIRRNKDVVVVTFAARLLWFMARFTPHLLDWIARQGWRGRSR